MTSTSSTRDSDALLADDSGLKPGRSSLDERIPSQSGTPSVEFVKHDKPRESNGSSILAACDDENICPNAETRLRRSGEEQRSDTCVGEPEPQQAPEEAVPQSCEDTPMNETFNDVSMMSVDGHMSVDFGPQENHSTPTQVIDGNIDSLSRGTSTFRRSDPKIPTSSCETDDRDQNSTFTLQASRLSTPADRSTRTARGSSVYDEDDLFLTPTQGTAEDGSQKMPRSSLEDSGDEGQLKRTFDKTDSEAGTVETKANETFDKEPSVVNLDNPSILGVSCKSPDFDLRLDSTCQIEESEIVSSRLNMDQMSTPVRKEVRGSFIYEGMPERDCESVQNENPASSQRQEDNEETESKERRGSSFMKRPCSILELSFVSSPKRGNFQVNTPKASDKSARSSLINFNESIAFDFSAAAKSAETNGGVAEMGSFVFASSSGLPVAGSDDPFDLRTLEKANNLAAAKDEKFTRVSFIAMFDPIKIQEGPQQASGTEAKTEVATAIQDRKSSIIASHRTSSVSSPLIKGLPTPVFAIPKPVKPVLKTLGVQTDPVVEEPSAATPPQPVQEEVEEEIVRLNDLVENQARALSMYEEVVKKLIEARRKKLENPGDDSKLLCRLSEERERNERLEDAVKSMERSMHSTLMRMQEFRTANEDLRKVVEEQQAALVDTRTELEDSVKQWQEDVSHRDHEKQELEAHLEDSTRSHEKAVSMLNLQLQAKDSEIESLNMQLSISRKEIDSLKNVVNSMKLQ